MNTFVSFVEEVRATINAFEVTHDFESQWDSERYDAVYNNGIRRGYTLSGGYRTKYDVAIPESSDWEFRYVNTKGTGNHGQLAMIPKSSRARHARRVGRVIALVKNHGMTIEQAILFDDARAKASVPFAHEAEVIELAKELIDSCCKAFIESIPEWTHGPHKSWVANNDLPEQVISAPRYQAGFAVAKEYLALNH